MSTPISAPQVATPENTPTFQIQRVYLKGISLEIPNAPQVFLEQDQFQVNFNLQSTVTKLEGDSTEVALRGTVEAVRGDKHIFVLEVDQAGIFEIKNVPADQIEQILEVTCPTILTPYLRTQITNTLLQSSMPQFMLPEINWLAGYLQRQQQKSANDPKH